MSKPIIGIIGGSGVCNLPGLQDLRKNASPRPGANRRTCCISGGSAEPRRCSCRAPRAGPPLVAVGHKLPGQYRRHEARRRHRLYRVGLGLRLVS